jgi:hypothetical protein
LIFYKFDLLWKEFVNIRQKYFRSPEYYNSVHAKTILVTKLRTSMLKDNYALAEAMEEVNIRHFSTASLAMKVTALDEAVKKREKYVFQLENLLHKEFKSSLKNHQPDSANNLALPNSQLSAAAQRICGKIRNLEDSIYEMRHNGCDAKAIHAGFIEFEYPEDCHEVVDQLQGKMSGLKIEPAPRPRDLLWGTLGNDPMALKHSRRVGNLLVLALCVGWIVPLAFIVPLSQPSTLGELWPDLGVWLAHNPKFTAGITSIMPPLMFSLFIMFLPAVFRFISLHQGAYTKAMLHSMTLRKFFMFYVVGFFVFFNVFSVCYKLFVGITWEKMMQKFKGPSAGANFLQKFEQYVNEVADVFVRKGGFWLNYMVNGCTFFPIELARAAPLVVSFFRHRFSSLTPRESMLINNPPTFDYDIVCTLLLFYFFITMVYAWIQPLVVIISALYFTFALLLYKYQLLFIFGKQSDTLGDLYPLLYKRVVFSLLFGQALLCVYLFSRKIYFPAGAIGILFLLSIFYYSVTSKKHIRNALYFNEEFGPWDPEALRKDAEARRSGHRERYLHPALVDHLILPFVDPRLEHLLGDYFPELGVGGIPGKRPSQDSLASEVMKNTAFRKKGPDSHYSSSYSEVQTDSGFYAGAANHAQEFQSLGSRSQFSEPNSTYRPQSPASAYDRRPSVDQRMTPVQNPQFHSPSSHSLPHPPPYGVQNFHSPQTMPATQYQAQSQTSNHYGVHPVTSPLATGYIGPSTRNENGSQGRSTSVSNVHSEAHYQQSQPRPQSPRLYQGHPHPGAFPQGMSHHNSPQLGPIRQEGPMRN